MAGHSKWAQIKHKKALTDAKKGKLFSKLSREITVAAKLGGINLDSNPRLLAAVSRAKSFGMPKSNIDRAIQKVSKDGEDGDLQEFLYEALGPGGSQVLIEGITDNKNRSLNEIRLLLTNNGARLADSGSLLWNFEKIGSIRLDLGDNLNKTKEEIETIIIESGAINFENVQESFMVETIFNELDKVKQSLERSSLKIAEIGHDYKPKGYLEINSSTKALLEKLLDILLEHEDVQEVYTNARDF